MQDNLLFADEAKKEKTLHAITNRGELVDGFKNKKG